jgi:alkyl hydroperoxide reductase subunit AhpF
MLKVNLGGSADNEATDVAVKPYGTPPWLTVMMATPAAWRRNISLNVPTKAAFSDATVIFLLFCLECPGLPRSATLAVAGKGGRSDGLLMLLS